MITEATRTEVPVRQTSVGLKAGIAVAAFLAAISIGIVGLRDLALEPTNADIGEPAVVDYALRHMPWDIGTSVVRADDYALRHMGE